jgi:hypothetical protein
MNYGEKFRPFFKEQESRPMCRTTPAVANLEIRITSESDIVLSSGGTHSSHAYTLYGLRQKKLVGR